MSSWAQLYGKKPIVPDAPDYVASLKKITKGNLDLVPSLTELATKSTKLYSDLMEVGTPGSAALREKTTGVINDWLEGKVPKDVQRQLSIFGAERASSTGVGGSIGDSWTAQDFGTTSYAIQREGVTAASRWLEQSRNGIFDFSKMFFGPQDAKDQAESKWNREWLANQVEAAPDPAARGHHDANLAIWGMAMGGYSGGPGYTQQYKPKYGSDRGPGGGGGGSGSSYFGGSDSPNYDSNSGENFDAPDAAMAGGGSGAGGSNDYGEW